MSLIEESWVKLREGVEKKGMDGRDINNLRLAYLAGVYLAAASIYQEGATADDINNAAYRIELRGVG